MNITKKSLHTLVDAVDKKDYEVLFHLLDKFIPTDIPFNDEIVAINIGKIQMEKGEVYKSDDIDWYNLDNMDL